MPITFTCPQCNTVSEVPDSAAGARGKCRACGSVVHVPAVVAKVCADCGADVSHERRTKDAEGRYYCNLCWMARQNEQVERNVEAAESISTSPKKSFWSSETGIILAIVAPLVLIGAAVVTWLLWSSHSERQLRNQIARMKDAADQRLAAGDPTAASKQYADLIAFAEKRKIQDDGSGTVAEVRRQKQAADARIEREAQAAQREQERKAAAQAAQLKQREAVAGAAFLKAIEPFAAACKQFRSAFDEHSERSKALASFEELKAEQTAYEKLLDATHSLAKEAKLAKPALDAIPEDLTSFRAICGGIQAAAEGIDSEYDKHNSVILDMTDVRLAMMTGQPANVDRRKVEREYSALIADLYAAAGVVVKTEPLVRNSLSSGDATSQKPISDSRPATTLPTRVTQTVFLVDMNEAKTDCWTDPAGRMVFHKRVCDWNNSPIAVGGEQSPNGLFTHPPERGSATVSYALHGTYDTFEAKVGIADDNDPQPKSAVVFSVMGDGKVLWTSSPIAQKRKSEVCSVSIQGVKELALVARATGSHYFAHAVWLEPQVKRGNGQ